MNKEQFFKAIDNVDDKLLKDVFDASDYDNKQLTEAETEHGAVYRPESLPKFLPRRKVFAAAAACLAVLGVGSFTAVKVMNSQHGSVISDSTISSGISLSAADSGRSDSLDDFISSSSTNGDVPDSNASDTPDASSFPKVVENDGENHWRLSPYKSGDAFEYEGKSYRVLSSGGTWGLVGVGNGIGSGSEFIIGVRREIIDGVDTVEFAAFLENVGTTPIGMMTSTVSPDKPIIFRLVPNDRNTEVYDSHHWFDNIEYKYMPIILQPGEKYYQTASFPITDAEYMFSICHFETDPDTFNESEAFVHNNKGGNIANQWVDFSDKSVSFDDVYKLFGSSNYAKEIDAVMNMLATAQSQATRDDMNDWELSVEKTTEPSRSDCYPE